MFSLYHFPLLYGASVNAPYLKSDENGERPRKSRVLCIFFVKRFAARHHNSCFLVKVVAFIFVWSHELQSLNPTYKFSCWRYSIDIFQLAIWRSHPDHKDNKTILHIVTGKPPVSTARILNDPSDDPFEDPSIACTLWTSSSIAHTAMHPFDIGWYLRIR